MTIVKLKGGLGNQMFQYATGLAVAKRNGQDLFIDASSYESQASKDTPRAYELSAFNLSHTKKATVTDSSFVTLFKRVRNKILPPNPYAFNSSVFNRRTLDGFFQNERYFLSIRSIVLEEFTLKSTDQKFKETQSFITGTKSVSMHVRRGDYVSNPYASAYHGTLTSDYFKRALDFVISKTGTDFTLFIFTDDIKWAQENITFHPNTFILSDQGFSPAEEMILMSSCQHNIIANSTFSWWGAWLNQNPGKIVVAPRSWTAAKVEADIIPPTWKKI